MGSKDPRANGAGSGGDELLAAEADELIVEADELIVEADELLAEADDVLADADDALVDADELLAEAAADTDDPAAYLAESDERVDVADPALRQVEPDPGVGEPRANVVGTADLFAEITRLVRGLVTLAVRALRSAMAPAGSTPDEGGSTPDEGGSTEPSLLLLIPGAAVALMIEAERQALRAAAVVDEQLGPVVRGILRLPLIQGPARAARRSLESLSARGVKEQQEAVEAAQALIERVLPELVGAVLDHIDLDDIVARIDIERVLDGVDLDAVVARVSIDDVLNRVDFNAVIDRVDIDGVVARVDIDGVVARVDIDAVIKRLDLAGLTSEVMTEVDLREIVRESSSSITGEAVDAVRVQGMNADRFVSRIVDKLLLRKAGRDLSGPSAMGTPGSPNGDARPTGPADDSEEGGEAQDAGRVTVPTP